MTVQVNIHTSLRQYIDKSASTVQKENWQIAEGTTVQQMMGILGLPESFHVLCLVNGKHCGTKEKVLKDGDSLFLFPLMTGG